jgi:hypothetical protein
LDVENGGSIGVGGVGVWTGDIRTLSWCDNSSVVGSIETGIGGSGLADSFSVGECEITLDRRKGPLNGCCVEGLSSSIEELEVMQTTSYLNYEWL